MRLDSRGFNLIELMVVVAVLAVLFSIAIPNYYAMKARAQEATTTANMYNFQIAIIHYSIDTGGIYPANTGRTLDGVGQFGEAWRPDVTQALTMHVDVRK